VRVEQRAQLLVHRVAGEHLLVGAAHHWGGRAHVELLLQPVAHLTRLDVHLDGADLRPDRP
jgi:hypothetical protein